MWWQAILLFVFLLFVWRWPQWLDRQAAKQREASATKANRIQRARDRANARRDPTTVEWVE